MMGCNSLEDTECYPDEKPYHSVSVPAFMIDKYAVTTGEYRRCMDAGVCTAPHSGSSCNHGVPDGDRHPINCVDWSQAKAYCAWAGKRLPTEAEWEKAARGTDGRKYPWGNDSLDCDHAVWNYSKCGNLGTAPVGSKPAGSSPYGAEDMIGNVWEWVEDWYHDGYAGAPSDGGAWLTPPGTLRVVRGGSWLAASPIFLRVSYRSRDEPWVWSAYHGFRCARD
jgi:formylglycine-generating enzyme required for sulfatase activity